MRKYVVSEAATADITNVAGYIAADRPVVAKFWLGRLYDTFERLGKIRKLGRRRPDLADGIRSFSFRPFLIFYRIEKHQVVVLRVLHGRQRTII